MIRRRSQTVREPPRSNRTLASSQRPYSACSASRARACARVTPAGNRIVRYSKSIIGHILPANPTATHTPYRKGVRTRYGQGMTTDPRAALTVLVAAFERHLEASASRRGEGDPVVAAAYRDLTDAFENYDDCLLDAFDEVTPFEVFRNEEDEDTDDDDEDIDEEDEEFDEPDEEGGTYTGLDDADYDEDDDEEPGSGDDEAAPAIDLAGSAAELSRPGGSDRDR
jgi:hypothetical protein